MNLEQLEKIRHGAGFIAALDQSGGSTPHALELYGIDPASYTNENEMFNLMHQMRSRIITSPSFTGTQIVASILFKRTMEDQVEGLFTADYLWQKKQVVPFLKIDNGLTEKNNGVQLMKPMPELADLLDHAKHHRIFGTKMRSLIHEADIIGVNEVVEQQFITAAQISRSGLIPIIEPEIEIHSPEKGHAEELLRDALVAQLDMLDAESAVVLKLTLPNIDNFYRELTEHPRVLRVAALSGGYSRQQACTLLHRNRGMIASFSRALTEGLRIDQADEEFNRLLSHSIESIFSASIS